MAVGGRLAVVRKEDPDFETRQVGMVALDGGSVSYTGRSCSYWAGYRLGDNYACQGNILTGPQVVDAMADTFESTQGSLFERLYRALMAANAVGGDARGRQSARIMVCREGAGAAGEGTVIDIRIEDHDDPIAELQRIREQRRVLVAVLGYSERLRDATEGDRPAILDEWRAFLDDKRQPRYLDWWGTLADGYLAAGRRAEALGAYRVYLEINPGLALTIAEEARAGRFPVDVARELGLM